MRPRVMPCLLLKDKGLVKGVSFKDHRYVGDPINAVNIFNTKEVDELVFLDITATNEGRTISLETVQKIADECYMPFAVGGGIRSVRDIKNLLHAGAEKVCINTAAIDNPNLVREATEVFGSQSIVVSIDVKRKRLHGYEVVTHSGKRPTGKNPVDVAVTLEYHGAGEIFLTSIDRDGTMEGYDIELIRHVLDAVNIPVIACGGAGKIEDFRMAVENGHASAVSAGSLFVFHGPRRAVLINFPTEEQLEKVFR